MSAKETVAILGGTGDLGTGLAIRWSKAGYKIVIGSRTQEKADEAVKALKEISPDTPAEAMENGAAAAAGDGAPSACHRPGSHGPPAASAGGGVGSRLTSATHATRPQPAARVER